MRKTIDKEATAGKTAEEIKEILVAQHGTTILGDPVLPGFALLAALAVATGLALLARVWLRRRPNAAPAGLPPTREELDALDDALDD